MDVAMILLKQLKAKHIISGKVEDSMADITSETITLKKATDLFIRDAITGLGTILKEDLDNHYYVMTVPVGLFGNVSTYALIQRIEMQAEIVVYAHEGLIKQNLSAKTIEKLKKALC